MSIRFPLPDKQPVIKSDASKHAAGYVLLIEDYTESDAGAMKSHAPVAFGSQRLTEGPMSLTLYAKECLAVHNEFAHILWGVKKPTIVMTDNQALTRFSESKIVSPNLWNLCYQALQYDFVLAHVPCTENPAAEYLSPLDIRPEERIHFMLTDENHSTTLRSICHPKPRSKTRTKRTLYLMETLPHQSSTKPSMPYWTRFTKATTRRVNSFERSRRSDHADQITPIRSRRSTRAVTTR